jgi:hypothetical protein
MREPRFSFFVLFVTFVFILSVPLCAILSAGSDDF